MNKQIKNRKNRFLWRDQKRRHAINVKRKAALTKPETVEAKLLPSEA